MSDPATTVEAVFRESYPEVLAGLVRKLRDIDLAEEAIQDAAIEALRSWPYSGVPANPAGWLAAVARRRAIDRIRRTVSETRRGELLARMESPEATSAPWMLGRRPADDRLVLIFTCCHPALDPDKQVALTLRTLGGLTTREIAEAFLVSETTMAQRLVRAKAKIRDAGIPFRVPADDEVEARLDVVLAVVYLIFNEGYFASSGASAVRVDLAESALDLGRLLAGLVPANAEVTGLLALMLLHHARRRARLDAEGDLVLLPDQDRGLWDQAELREGLELVEKARAEGGRGPYFLQACIAAEHGVAESWESTHWLAIVELYDHLLALTGSPVVALNRAVAVAHAFDPEAGLAALASIDLDGYHSYHAARGEMLRRSGDHEAARRELERALETAVNDAERRLIRRRLRSFES